MRDPNGAESLRLAPRAGGENGMLWVLGGRGGAWYLSDEAGELATGRVQPLKRWVDALHYSPMAFLLMPVVVVALVASTVGYFMLANWLA